MNIRETVRSLFTRTRTDPDKYWPWECPRCNMAIDQDTKEGIVLCGVFHHCPACGEPVDVMEDES